MCIVFKYIYTCIYLIEYNIPYELLPASLTAPLKLPQQQIRRFANPKQTGLSEITTNYNKSQHNQVKTKQKIDLKITPEITMQDPASPSAMDTEELYLIEKAKITQATDPSAAKAWILAAKTLYPSNFAVQVSIVCVIVCFSCFFNRQFLPMQFEAYGLEKSAQNTEEAAKCLSYM